MLNKFIFFLFFLINIQCIAQKKDSINFIFEEAEQKLNQIQKGFLSRIENERIEANKKFIAVWDELIDDSKILNYPFDSIKEASILSPKNKQFKLITWNLNKDDGSQLYFGYLLVNNIKRVKKSFFNYEIVNEYEAFKLIDYSNAVKSPENYISGPNKWFGMLYTQLIECDGYYTLIGWDGNDKLIQRKFIDILSFKADGSPIFGKDVFKLPKKNPKRMMFEYSSELSMSLKYDKKSEQIRYSHLAAREDNEILALQFQYYGPDGSFDGLKIKNNKWESVLDIDGRNEKNKNDNVKKPDPKKQKAIFKPK